MLFDKFRAIVLLTLLCYIYFRYESCIDAEIQQRAVEYITLSRKGAALVDIMAEMPKFPERQVHSGSIGHNQI